MKGFFELCWSGIFPSLVPIDILGHVSIGISTASFGMDLNKFERFVNANRNPGTPPKSVSHYGVLGGASELSCFSRFPGRISRDDGNTTDETTLMGYPAVASSAAIGMQWGAAG